MEPCDYFSVREYFDFLQDKIKFFHQIMGPYTFLDPDNTTTDSTWNAIRYDWSNPPSYGDRARDWNANIRERLKRLERRIDEEIIQARNNCRDYEDLPPYPGR